MAMKNETDDEMKRWKIWDNICRRNTITLPGWVVLLLLFVIGPIMGVIIISGMTLVAYVIAHILGIDFH